MNRKRTAPESLKGWARTAIAAVAGCLCLAAGTEAAAQSSSALSPSARFTCADTSACDIEGILTLKFAVENIPASYSQVHIDVQADNESGFTRYSQSVVEIVNNEIAVRVHKDNYKYNPATGRTDLNFKIVRARIAESVDEKDWVELRLPEPSVQTWHLYGTPKTDEASVGATIPGCIKILNRDRECGFDLTLRAHDAWAANSRYEWTSSSDNFTIDPEGTTSELRQIRFSGQGAAQAMTTTITLRQTVGGICTSTVSKQITLLGQPEATLSRDNATDEPAVAICTSVEADDDPARIFSGHVLLAGEAPFAIELSTGDKYKDLALGDNSFDGAIVNEAGRVVLATVTDRNGCVAPPSMIHGYIDVRDRKPLPFFRNDSVACENRTLSIEVQPTSHSHTFEWGLMPGQGRLDAGINGNTYAAQATSNMNSAIDYYVIETDEEGSVACPSDTTVLTVAYGMPLRYPNAFSPNGDGRNDKLVIEGLPSENMLMVIDSRGKKVFETHDYRNDWEAEGLPDGYYVYIFKGRGTKTVKETLAIKRTNR